ncbi:MAG: tRNA lysidine(34) synthetase TilS [Clostridia bacterium]|nr:tRNA lysidine(34) synthetase TilS [Clostridia bacterium]
MIEKIILDTAASYSLFPENSVVTVALSGGADSVALLYALYRLQNKLKIKVKAAHLNHQIRGNEALRDEDFVKKLCSSLDIPLIVKRADVPKFATEKGLSLETAARQVRYEFLNRINEGVIATAHTASDNLETVILNLARGTALDGLCGIPVKRDNIVRPIISATREMVEDYCKQNGLSFVTDSTNLSDDYTRNKIRHKIVPVLKELNPRIEKSVFKTSRCVSTVSELLEKEAKNYIKNNFANNTLKLLDFELLNSEIAKRVILEFVKSQNSEISLETCHIESIYEICLIGGKTSIPKNMYALSENGILKLGTEGEIPKTPRFSVRISKKMEKINNLLLNNSLDCDKIVGKLVVRTRQSGDSIRLLNRGCSKTLTKLYNECKVSKHLRDALPVISDDEGVVWIYTLGVAQRCAVTGSTKTAYEIEVKENGLL